MTIIWRKLERVAHFECLRMSVDEQVDHTETEITK